MQNKKLKNIFVLLMGIFVLFGLTAAVSVKAGWKKEGVEINKGSLDVPYSWETRETIISDKSGVIFIYKSNKRFYIQKINAQGEKMWGENGLYVCGAAHCSNLGIVSDGFGGTIIAFNVHNKIYAQRINKWGERQWYPRLKVNQILIADAKKGSNPAPVMVSDKKGGAIIGWHDDLDPSGGIYVARVDYRGNVLWKKSGKELFKGRSQGDIRMISDKKGYIYINNQGVLQKINRNGQLLWPAQGIDIMSAPGFEGDYYKMIFNNKDGIIIVGQKQKGPKWNLFAQKIDFYGKLKWSKKGVLVSNFAVANYDIVSDGRGGVVVTWVDERIDKYRDIYAQRINNKGKRVWGKNDKAIGATSEEERSVQIILSSKKEVIIGSETSSGYRFQKINKEGVLQWGNEGIVLPTYTSIALIREVNDEFIVLESKYIYTPSRGHYIYAYKIDQYGNILGD